MSESMFSIFPDTRLPSGHNLKGKGPRSQKTALCDVKNILSVKSVTTNEPLKKAELLPSSSKPGGVCKPLLKETVKGTPAKCVVKQEGTFSIAGDDKENDVTWSNCGKCHDGNDDFFEFRPRSKCLDDSDIKYLCQGMFQPPKQEIPILSFNDELAEAAQFYKIHMIEPEKDFPARPISPYIFDEELDSVTVEDSDVD